MIAKLCKFIHIVNARIIVVSTCLEMGNLILITKTGNFKVTKWLALNFKVGITLPK